MSNAQVADSASKPINLKSPLIPLKRPNGPVNFMYLLMEAVAKDQNTLTKMQIIDSKATLFAVKMTAAIYEYWYGSGGPISHAQSMINKYAYGKASKQNTNEMYAWQARFNQDSARAQSNSQQEDGVVQSTQGQTSSDANNLEMKARMIQGINGILSALTNMLGRITA